MKIVQTDITARRAADIFASEKGEGCSVSRVSLRPEGGIRFTVIGNSRSAANRWYIVRLLPNYAGWEVVPELEAGAR